MVRLLLSCSLAAFVCFPAAAAIAQVPPSAPPPTGKPGAVDKAGQTDDVRFKNEMYQRMTVEVSLGGKGPYRFLVDTGADRTAVSREVAAALQLPRGTEVRLHDVAGVSDVSTAKIPELLVTRKPVRIADAPLLDSANIGADGILGTDSLASKRVMFDFAARTMSVVPSSAPDFHDEPGTIVIEGKRRNGRLILTDAVADGRDLTVVIDTGSEVSIGNQALRSALKSSAAGAFNPVEIESVTGEKIQGEFAFLKELHVGGITLKNLVIVFAPAHTFKQLKLDRKPALLLGMNAIRAFKKVSIDFAKSTFRVIVPEHSELDIRTADPGSELRMRVRGSGM